MLYSDFKKIGRIYNQEIPKNPSIKLLEDTYYESKTSNSQLLLLSIWQYGNTMYNITRHQAAEQDFLILPYAFPYAIEDGIHCILYCKQYTRTPHRIVKRLLKQQDVVAWKGKDKRIWDGLYYHVIIPLKSTQLYEDWNRSR